MTYLNQMTAINTKRMLILGTIYTSLEIIGLILSTLGFFESDIRLYVLAVVLVHIGFISLVLYRRGKQITKVDEYIIYAYIITTIIWSILFSALVYLSNEDITIIAIVLMLTSSLFILKPKIHIKILLICYVFYVSSVVVQIESQLVINELCFKGLIFFVFAYILTKLQYDNRLLNYNLSEQLIKNNVQLKEKSIRDSLSGLYHNAYIFNFLEEHLDNDIPLHTLSVLMMDIDNFKSINDTYGHLFGDTVIRSIANELRVSTNQGDVLGRYGGEEYIVILNNADMTRTITVAETIRTNIENMTFQYPMKVTISIGIAFYNGETARELIQKADEQLYRAKALGKNRVSKGEEI